MTSSFRRYLQLYTGAGPRLLAFLALALLQFVAAAPLPFVVKEVFDTAIADERVGLLVGLTGLMIGLQLLSIAIGLIAANWLLRVSTQAVRNLRGRVFDTLYSLSIRFHETASLGALHDRVVHESERVDAMTRNGYAIALPSVVFIVGILGVLVFISWTLFLVTVAFVPIIYVISRVSRKVLRRASRRLHGSVEAFSETTFRALRHMRQIRILGAESQALAEHDEVLAEAARAAHNHGLIQRSYLAINRVAIAAWVAGVLVVGGAAVINGTLTLGELFSFYAGLALIRQPIDLLIRSVPVIVAGHEALDRVFELLDEEAPRPYQGELKLEIRGHVSVQGVGFEYEEGIPVLRGASLEVRPGEVVALMGPNGAGKTTLADLIVGFYKPTQGRIQIDGHDLEDLDLRHARRQFGVVTQDPIMVPGTVRENITYGRATATDDDIVRAVEKAAAGPLIEELEAGLSTRAYENGPLLSGGQLQRVALARALLGHPRLLILDEPSNHLDVEGLEGLLRGLRSLDEAPAMILITHKDEVAAVADSVFTMDEGRVHAVDGVAR